MATKAQLLKQLFYAKLAINSFSTIDEKISKTNRAVSTAGDNYRSAIKCSESPADLSEKLHEKSVAADGGLSSALQSSKNAKKNIEQKIEELKE